MHGSRQEGAGWCGVEINLSNKKSKKKKASEGPPTPPGQTPSSLPQGKTILDPRM